MLTDFEKDEQPESNNYPTLEDDAFTPDEQDLIKEYKDSLKRKIEANRGVLKGLKFSLGTVSSYSLAKFLILSFGTSGIAPAVATVFTINFLSNTDTLDSLNIDRKDQNWSTEGMGKLFKFAFSSVISACILWASIGEFYQMVNSSKQTYRDIQNTVTEFNKLPEKEQNWGLVAVGAAGVAVGVLAVTRSR